MQIKSNKLDGKWITFVLQNNNNMEVHILNFGGIITKILVPDKHGNFENVVLGYKNYQDYKTDSSNFFGAIIGRVAGRIKKAYFELDGNKYELEPNDGANHLHSGSNGFHRVLWDAVPFETATEIGVKLFYISKDGENGYPGNVCVTVTYMLNNNNQLIIDYSATTDKATPFTLTNHTYFNLSGNLKNLIQHHFVTVNSPYYLELNNELTPTGEILNTQNTTFDFIQGRTLNEGINSDFKQNKVVGNGYDHYFLFDKNQIGKIKIIEESSGRILNIETNHPGMVMYTANNLEKGIELDNGPSRKYLGICFETQGPPASLHHETLPTIVLHKDEIYNKQTIYSFGIQL
ncbi:galactose mutarotase [Bacilli bacterium]|uniref:aldose epimerase family protein n=1 Tax=Oceanobacillus sp. FSL K6-0118 TaxID=2921418 RepID=UPI0006220CCA|nr:aldose epimerase [Bacilli bacterium VT-13-104]PZD88012.1 galactose mutarotase [Bacilli bacterium]PZD90203.1 galactose mutarotase [Bacilli bacterium]PZD92097.1 galactose mutarotase [Bacilli bacterium]RCO06981.1 galactose mutarotase [Bacilli bacterium]